LSGTIVSDRDGILRHQHPRRSALRHGLLTPTIEGLQERRNPENCPG
jgi:hypothetical protein